LLFAKNEREEEKASAYLHQSTDNGMEEWQKKRYINAEMMIRTCK